MAIELRNWIQNTSSDDSLNGEVAFDLEDLARMGGFPDTVKHMQQIMEQRCIKAGCAGEFGPQIGRECQHLGQKAHGASSFSSILKRSMGSAHSGTFQVSY